MTERTNRAELLSPAGNWDCARAAVANGADAIYFGMPRFNARLRADNFTAEDLPELMRFLHAHGVRGFVAFNTLVFQSELGDAATQLALLEESGVDAVIVQDLGLARMVREMAPDLELHASTQMTITSPEGLAFIERTIGLDRAVLARELSLRELKRFGSTPPLEVFVHGALCVAYSGQCLTSESLGQRSANRGECAQACRMPYQLVVDGEDRELGDQRYLLSPQDLAAVDRVPELIEHGVYSFKIEGRLKSPEYVAAVTKVYRQALDRALAGSPAKATDADRYALEMTFSRGLSTGWLDGADHPKLTHGRYNKKRGAYVGTIENFGRGWIELTGAETPVRPGDGIVFSSGGDTNDEQGGRIYKAEGLHLEIDRLSNIDFRRLSPGDQVWKTSDPALEKSLRSSFRGRLNTPAERLDTIDFRVTGRAGTPLELAVVGTEIAVGSAIPLEPAKNRPLDDSILARQLGKLGGTPYRLGKIENAIEGSVALPLSELNALRRSAVDQFAAGHRSTTGRSTLQTLLPERAAPSDQEPSLAVLVRTGDQLAAALDAGVQTIYADYEDIRLYRDAVAQVRAHGSGSQIYLATPRIQKPGEAGYFKLIDRAAPDGVLVRNLGAIDYLEERPDLASVGDFSLNVANALTAKILKEEAGLDRLTVSYDLNIGQVIELVGATPPSWLELTLHQHMPMFHMEHCVFCAFLSDGHDYRDCGRPCEKHEVQLRDRVGQLHLLKADVGCRNTLFRGQAQTAARYYRDLAAAGLRQFRLELLSENASESAVLIRDYQALLAGTVTGDALHQTLDADSRLGVVEGTMVTS